MRASALWMLLGVAVPTAAAAQPRAEASDAPGALAAAARDGVRALSTARLDRLGDMATTDLAPLDDGPGVAADGAWPGGEAPAETAWDSCGIAGPVEPVDLRTGPLTPVQVALASRGARSVALVALGRPGGDRHGMAFPEARWVEWSGGRAQVFATRGFAPDAAILLGDRDATVLSYARVEPHSYEGRHSHTPDLDWPVRLALTDVGPRGEVLRGPHELDATDGWQIDSPLVAWDHGTAVVLGRTARPTDLRRREVLHFFDGRGHPARAPLELTDQSRDDGFGETPAGLLAAPDGDSLAASWMVPDGPIAGVWVRRGITMSSLPFVPGTAHIVEAPPSTRAPRQPPLYPRGQWVYRVAQGAGYWGPWVTRGGVIFRRGANPLEASAPLTEVMFSPWPSARRAAASRLLGAAWDPLTTWTPGGPLLTGFTRPAGAPASARSLAVRYAGGGAMRAFDVPLDAASEGATASLRGLRDAVDVAVAQDGAGALLAWIEAPTAEAGASRLDVARIACTASAAPARPAAPPAPVRPSGRTRGTSPAGRSRN